MKSPRGLLCRRDMKSIRSFPKTFGSGCRIAVLVIGLALAGAPLAHAAGVVSTCDETHLRAALAGGGTVTFTCSGTITLGSTITISSDTTIDGTGQNVTISGGNAIGVFAVQAGVKFSVNKFTIANGNSSYGGGIYSYHGTVTVSNSTFSGDSAGSWGGAIGNVDGSLTVVHSLFSGNSAASGGAIHSDGIAFPDVTTLIVRNSTFSGNSAETGGAIHNHYGKLTVSDSTFSGNTAAYGGAVTNEGPSAPQSTATLTGSTFSANSATFGGGIYTSYGTMSVSNSTLSSNSAGDTGGGINNSYGSTLTLINTTFSGNRATSGGGIFNYDTSTLTLRNTIVANSATGGNCAIGVGGSLTDGGGNLRWPSTDSSCMGSFVDPNLGPLQDNDGPTQTMALGVGSLAIGGAVAANCPISDQRGFPRPFTFPCSIGAFEPGILFGSFQTNAIVDLAGNAFAVSGTFSLGASNNGISPRYEAVRFRFGTFSTTIPAGSFVKLINGGFVYVRLVNGVPTFGMTIQPLGGNKYFFAAAAQPASPGSRADNPLAVQLTIGDDGGTTTAQARFVGYSAAAEFSPALNPSGTWSYGWSTSRGSTFNLLPSTVPLRGVDVLTGNPACEVFWAGNYS